MNDLALIIALFLCVAVGWLLGIVSVPEHPNVTVSQNIVEIKDCKDIKLDTVSYNFMDSTYVIRVNIK
jgi:hypothetical protein